MPENAQGIFLGKSESGDQKNREEDVDYLTSGWEFGANAMAAAKSKTEGGAFSGAISVSPGVHLYQLTEQGLIVGVSLTGAKYYKDEELN